MLCLRKITIICVSGSIKATSLYQKDKNKEIINVLFLRFEGILLLSFNLVGIVGIRPISHITSLVFFLSMINTCTLQLDNSNRHIVYTSNHLSKTHRQTKRFTEL